MRILLSVIIFFTFLIKMGGYYAYLMLERHEIRDEIEHKLIHSIPKSTLKCIIANQENSGKIEWRRVQKEFKFEDELYDVVSVEIHDGISYYFCINDHAETLLETKIDNLLKLQSGHLPLSDYAKNFLSLLLEPITIHSNLSYIFNYFTADYQSNFPQVLITFSSSILFEQEKPPQF